MLKTVLCLSPLLHAASQGRDETVRDGDCTRSQVGVWSCSNQQKGKHASRLQRHKDRESAFGSCQNKDLTLGWRRWVKGSSR